tara:strand:+ start:1770 stop:2138 length:369 start_codon:yes stop_codon:yes gene_type:complete
MDKGWELYQMYDVVEHTIDYAFKGKFMLNMYEYLKSTKATKRDVEEFINSPTALEINTLILDLEDYMEGGNDSEHKQLREAYGHLGKPEARKIRNYLYEILQDAWKYEQEKKPGRKRKRPSK